jgi:hypothetical protein
MGPLEPISRRRNVSPSLHAAIKHLLLVVTASKGGVTLALVQVAIIVTLTLGSYDPRGRQGGAQLPRNIVVAMSDRNFMRLPRIGHVGYSTGYFTRVDSMR